MSLGDFIIYAMCPECMIMHGPFASDAQRNQFYDNVHYQKCVGVKQIPKKHREAVEPVLQDLVATQVGSTTVKTPAVVAFAYQAGDVGPPFPSRYSGTCFHCRIGYFDGDYVRMVTPAEGGKGKAVHEDCGDPWFEEWAKARGNIPQSEEPPF